MQPDVPGRPIGLKTQAGTLIDGAVTQLCFAGGAGLEYGWNTAVDDIDQPANGARSIQQGCGTAQNFDLRCTHHATADGVIIGDR